jgi:hypothetical protein
MSTFSRGQYAAQPRGVKPTHAPEIGEFAMTWPLAHALEKLRAGRISIEVLVDPKLLPELI